MKPLTASADNSYPRLLIYSSSVFNSLTGGGVMLSNLFSGWPKDKIAAIHWDALAPETSVCELYYKLGSREIAKPWPLREKPASQDGVSQTQTTPLAAWRPLLQAVIGEELPRAVRLSSELNAWINSFQPELIYSIMGTLPYLRLLRLIVKHLQKPLVIHMMDDWPATLYKKGLLAPWMRLCMQRELKWLLRQARERLVICEAMAQAYHERYGYGFKPYQNTIEADLWTPYRKTNYQRQAVFELLYAGSLLSYSQVESLSDIAQAVIALNQKGLAFHLSIHSPPSHAALYRSQLEHPPFVTLEPPLQNADIAGRLSAADCLVLAVNFDKPTQIYIRYSMPAKIPAYLLSGAPILVYGPSGVASVDYALKEGWGYVVKERSGARLQEALTQLAGSENLRKELGKRALSAGLKNHDAKLLRPAFHKELQNAATG